MTERRFYIWIAFLPLALPLLAALTLWSLHGLPDNTSWYVGFAGLICLTGLFSAIPYAIVLIGLFWRLRAGRPVNFRFLVVAVPVGITIVFAPVFSLTLGFADDIPGFFLGMVIGGGWALTMGLFYAGAIESLRVVGTRIGWITIPESSGPDPV